jgi:hypothetical protein
VLVLYQKLLMIIIIVDLVKKLLILMRIYKMKFELTIKEKYMILKIIKSYILDNKQYYNQELLDLYIDLYNKLLNND